MKRISFVISCTLLLLATGFAQITIDRNKTVISPAKDMNRVTKLFPVINPVTIAADKIKMYDDFRITYYSPWENTLAAIEPIPGTSADKGRIVLSCGQNVDFPIATRFLFKTDGTITDTGGNKVTVKFPELDSAAYGTDNQIIRLKDGSLLQMRNSNTWKAMQDKPSWADTVIVGKKGNRGSTMFWRSTDNGDNWQLHSIIDFGSKALQRFGAPRAMNCKGDADVALSKQCSDPAKDRWWIGGGDRPELYACPYTGTIYLTTRIISNTWESGKRLNSYLLFYSRDNGKTWTLGKDDFPSYEPLVMTSTPDGRLLLFQQNGSNPEIYIAKFVNNTRISAVNNRVRSAPVLWISKAYPVFYGLPQNPKSILGPMKYVGASGPDSLGVARIDRLAVGTQDIARASESADSTVVYAAYQVINKYNNQDYCIIRISFAANSNEPVVSNVLRIEAPDPATHSVMHGSFIQPDFVKVPGNIKSGLCMFYWVEVPRGGQTTVKSFSIKYILLRNGHYTVPAVLPRKLGQPMEAIQNFSIRTGDYMRGGFFYHNNRYHFVPQWPEYNGIHANIVAVDPDAIPF